MAGGYCSTSSSLIIYTYKIDIYIIILRWIRNIKFMVAVSILKHISHCQHLHKPTLQLLGIISFPVVYDSPIPFHQMLSSYRECYPHIENVILI